MASSTHYHKLSSDHPDQALVSDNQRDPKKPEATVKEISAGSTDSEKPKAPSFVTMPSYQRSLELSRPKLKQKPLPLDRLYHAWTDQAPLVKGVVITVITGIPFLVFFLIARYAIPRTTIGPKQLNATVFNLAKWLITCWASFMALLWCGRVLAAFSSWVCSLSRSLAGFERLAHDMCLRVVLLIWAAVGYALIPTAFHHSVGANAEKAQTTVYNWVHQLQRAFMFLMIAFAIIFVQGILLQLISIQYIEGWMGPRSQRASDELETIKKLRSLVNPHVSADDIGMLRKICKKLFLPIDSNDLYYQISNGRGDEDKWIQYATDLWHSISHGKEALTPLDIDQQLRNMNRDPAAAQDLFMQLDASCDGSVTQDELEKLMQRIGLQLNVRAQAQRGISSLLRKLEAILSIVMLGIILFIYIQFFEKSAAKDLGVFWTGLTGLSFAFGGVLLEFTNACVFVFGKHPYDVGDYIESKGKKLIVNKIFLTHTNFEEVSDPDERGIVVQISHAVLTSEAIVNWTRTMEAVVEKKKNKAEEDARKDKEKSEKEAKEKEEDRDLILLKAARLRSADNTPSP